MTNLEFLDIEPNIHSSVFVAPSVDIIGDVTIGEQSSIWYGCVLRADINRIVIGGATSAEAVGLIPVLDETNVICVSPSASAPGLAQQSRLFYRIFPSDELEGLTAGQFLHDRLDEAKVVLYTGNTEYTRGIEPEFRRRYEENLGGEVSGRIELDQEDWRSQSTRTLKETGVNAVCVLGYAPEILEVLRHLDKEGFKGRILTTSAFFSTKIIKEAGDLAEGVP